MTPQGAPPPPQPGAGPANLLSANPNQPPEMAGPTPEQQMAGFMMEIRDITMRIASLAQEFPVAAEDFQLASQALINSMTKVVISSSNTEPMSAPNVIG